MSDVRLIPVTAEQVGELRSLAAMEHALDAANPIGPTEGAILRSIAARYSEGLTLADAEDLQGGPTAIHKLRAAFEDER